MFCGVSFRTAEFTYALTNQKKIHEIYSEEGYAAATRRLIAPNLTLFLWLFDARTYNNPYVTCVNDCALLVPIAKECLIATWYAYYYNYCIIVVRRPSTHAKIRLRLAKFGLGAVMAVKLHMPNSILLKKFIKTIIFYKLYRRMRRIIFDCCFRLNCGNCERSIYTLPICCLKGFLLCLHFLCAWTPLRAHHTGIYKHFPKFMQIVPTSH